MDEPERKDRDHEAGRVEEAAELRPRRLADRDICRVDRRREHRVVDLAVAQLPEDVRHAVVHGAVHRRRREERGGDVRGVRDAVHAADEVPEAEAEREEIEDRLEEAADDRQPRAAVDHEVPLEQQVTACAAAERERAHSTSLFWNVRRASNWPTATHRTDTRRARATARACAVPSVKWRVRSTPFQSGVA